MKLGEIAQARQGKPEIEKVFDFLAEEGVTVSGYSGILDYGEGQIQIYEEGGNLVIENDKNNLDDCGCGSLKPYYYEAPYDYVRIKQDIIEMMGGE